MDDERDRGQDRDGAPATTNRAMLERLCRLCQRDACERCPVAGALRRVDAGSRGDFGL